jgi:hypothetical protein
MQVTINVIVSVPVVINLCICYCDGLCGLVVRIPGYSTRGPRYESRCYQIFWEVVGLEWGPLSLASTIKELLGRISSGSCLETRKYGHMDLLCWPHNTLYRQKLTLTSSTSDGHMERENVLDLESVILDITVPTWN